MQLAIDIIERAKRKKIDEEIVALNKDIAAKSKELDLLKSKEQSAKIQLEQDTKKRDDLRKSIAELQALKALIPEDDYKTASDELSKDSIVIENAIHNNYNELRTIRNDIATAQATISQRTDRLRSLAGPNAVKNLHIPTGGSENRPDEFFFAQCRSEIKDLFNVCNRIERDLKGKDVRSILLNATITAAKIRRFSDKPINSAEQIILYRAMGRIIVLGKNTPCYIDCINKYVNEDWDRYIEAKQKELWEYERMMEKRKELAVTNAAVASMEVAIENSETEEDCDQALMLELSERHVIEKTRGLRVLVFGGVIGDRRNMDWVQDVLQLGKLNILTTDRRLGSAADSLKNGGTDLMVLVTKWISHSEQAVVVDAAKKNRVAIARCNSSSKRALIRSIADCLCPISQEVAMAK